MTTDDGELRIIDVEQGSEEWHALRRQYRPASMAPWITGASRYAGPKQALEHFRGEERKVSQYTRRLWDHGRALEPVAATKLEDLLAISGEPAVGVRGEYLASLDFYNASEGLGVEIKCPYAGLRSKTWEYAARGVIDPGYADQIESQCRVFGLKRAGLFVYVSDEHNIFLPYEPSDERWAAIKAAWERFFGMVEIGVDPEAPVEVSDPQLLDAAKAYSEILGRIEAMEAEASALRARIEKAAGGRSTKFGDILVVRYETRAGSVDYKALVRDHCPGVDIEEYRDESVRYSKIILGGRPGPAEPAKWRANGATK